MTDLAIIGGGPAGYVAAERAAAGGMNVVVFERKELGGTCLNEGCIPTKTLLYSAKLYDTVRAAGKYGIAAADVSFDYGKMLARKNRVVRRLTGGIAAKLKAQGVQVVKGEAVIRGRTDDAIRIDCGGETYTAKNLLICTGSEAIVPPIEGADRSGGAVLTSREMLALAELPKSLAIVGGGVIGMEFASLCNSLGMEVTVIEMLPEILPGFDGEIAVMLRESHAKRGVRFELGCRVTKIDGGRVHFSGADGAAREVEAEKILMSVGRRAVVEGFGLETLGVEFDRNGIHVDDRMRTNVPGVYAAGDVTGRSMFAHTAYREADVVANNLAGGDDRMDYDAIPGVVYTNPEAASAGLTADAARNAGLTCREIKLPMTYSGRFMAENENETGLCKIVVGDGDELLGVHLLGNPASEIIYGAGLAMQQKMTLAQLKKTIFPHPTVSEIVRETLFAP